MRLIQKAALTSSKAGHRDSGVAVPSREVSSPIGGHIDKVLPFLKHRILKVAWESEVLPSPTSPAASPGLGFRSCEPPEPSSAL